MPVIKQFNGPRAALTLHYLRVYRWVLPLGTIFAVFLGQVLPVRPMGGEFDGIPTLIYFIMIAVSIREQGHTGFQLRIPARTSFLVSWEMLITALVLIWFWLCHAVTYKLSQGSFEFNPPFKFVAFGLLGLTFGRQRGVLTYRLQVLWWLALLAIFNCIVFAVATVLGEYMTTVTFPWAGSSSAALPWACAIFALYLSVLVQFRVLVNLTAKLRFGEDVNEEDYVEVFGPDTTAAHGKRKIHSTRDLDSNGEIEFASRNAAHHWYTLHLFLRTALWSGVFWSCTLIALSWSPFVFSLPGDSDTPYADIASAVALALLTARFGWWWVEPGEHLPVSIWSQSDVYLRMAVSGLVIASAILWFTQLWSNYSDRAFLDTSMLSPELFFTALWTGWCGLALAPGVLLSIGLALVPGFFGASVSPLIVTFSCLFWLALLLGLEQRLSGCTSLSNLTRPFIAMVALLAGQAVLGHAELPVPVGYCLRETLGAVLVLALIRHHVSIGLIPGDTARSLGIALVSLVVASIPVALTWNPFTQPGQGVMASYLVFGFVPTLFLPFLTVPLYIDWIRARSMHNKKMREKMEWTA